MEKTMNDIRQEINQAIEQLESQGINKNSHLGDTTGLGDK